MRWHNWQDRGAPHCLLLPCEILHHEKFLFYCKLRPMANVLNYVEIPWLLLPSDHESFKSFAFKHSCHGSSRSMKYIGLFWLHFRATCAIPVETWQRPSGFCLQLSFFLSGMSLANSRFEIWFSFNAIDASVSCFINLICNGNISNNHSSPHSVFG